MVERLVNLVRTVRTSGRGHGGAVVTSMAESLRRAMLLALAAWQLLMVVVVLVADPRVPLGLLVVLHVGLAVLALAAVRDLVPFEVCVLLGYGVWATDYLGAHPVNDVLTLAACWLGNLLYVAPALALRTRARTWIPLLGPTLVVAIIVLVDPQWNLEDASTFVVTACAIVVAARLAMPALWSLAEQADANVARLEEERRSDEVVRRTSAEAAEDARLVHDTVINTLGAVANGVRAGTEEAVRSRCRDDLDVVDGMLRGRRGRGARRLGTIGETNGVLEVHRTGLSGSDLDELQDVLAPEVLDALVGAAEEAVRNAGKHAGVATVSVDVGRSGTDVVVTVADRGVGFDAGGTAGHGIRGSIRERVEQVGGDVALTSRPGHGATVRITCPVSPPAGAPDGTAPVDVAGLAAHLVRRATWLAGIGVVAVGIVIELVNRPGELTWTYGMLALVAGCVLTAYLAVRSTGRLPGAVAALLVVALPVGFVATMAAIGFGHTEVFTYQAIGTVPLLAVLVAVDRLRAAVVASGLLAATAVVLAAVTWWDEGAGYGVVVLVGVAPALGLGFAWWSFQRLVLRVVTDSEAARADAAAAAVEVAARREIAAARRRWGTASLERSADLLRGIGGGALDLADPSVWEACAAEEGYLRQLLLLSPAAYRMSPWFAHALAAARAREVRLVIRSGDQDAPDEPSADALGELILQTVANASVGADLSVGWFPTPGGTRLVLVGPSGDLRHSLPASWSATWTELQDRTMVEVVVA